MIVIDGQCDRCKHRVREPSGASPYRCAAFPDGIPTQLIMPDVAARRPPHDHRQPYPGDHGVRFEPLPGQRHPLDVVRSV